MNICSVNLDRETTFLTLLPSPPPQVRRQGEIIQKIVHMIGHSVKLYDMVLQFLRTLFVKTRNVHYCTLRAELLMALHDLEIQVRVTFDQPELSHPTPRHLVSLPETRPPRQLPGTALLSTDNDAVVCVMIMTSKAVKTADI